MRRIELHRGGWEAGISVGLTLPCRVCGKVPKFDYLVDDTFWKQVVEEKDRLDVVCLPCLDKLATAKDLDVSEHLEEVQFTGINKTIMLIPARVYLYNREEP